MLRAIQKGTVNQTIDVRIQNSSSTTGAGLTGLAFNTASLVCYYRRGATGTATQLPLVTQTAGGAHTDGGFVEVSAANMPGLYRLDLSDAVIAAGASYVTVMLKGATNMAEVTREIPLVDYDPEGDIVAIKTQTDRMTFNGANEVAAAITNAAAFAQSAADKTWTSSSRTLTSFGTLVAEIWGTICESAGAITAKQIMSLALSVLAGVTANGRKTFKTPNGASTRVVVTITGSERTNVTLTPSG